VVAPEDPVVPIAPLSLPPLTALLEAVVPLETVLPLVAAPSPGIWGCGSNTLLGLPGSGSLAIWPQAANHTAPIGASQRSVTRAIHQCCQ
jgi:hypothetical protein